MDKKTKNLLITIAVILIGVLGIKFGLGEDATKQLQSAVAEQKEVETLPETNTAPVATQGDEVAQ